MTNDTMRKFGFPDTLVRDFEYWVVLLRPAQVTLGSLVLAAKSDATAFGALPPRRPRRTRGVTADIEAALQSAVGYERINYLMLMMVDPHVHFHVFPRYEGARSFETVTIEDQWLARPARPQVRPGDRLARSSND